MFFVIAILAIVSTAASAAADVVRVSLNKTDAANGSFAVLSYAYTRMSVQSDSLSPDTNVYVVLADTDGTLYGPCRAVQMAEITQLGWQFQEVQSGRLLTRSGSYSLQVVRADDNLTLAQQAADAARYEEALLFSSAVVQLQFPAPASAAPAVPAFSVSTGAVQPDSATFSVTSSFAMGTFVAFSVQTCSSTPLLPARPTNAPTKQPSVAHSGSPTLAPSANATRRRLQAAQQAPLPGCTFVAGGYFNILYSGALQTVQLRPGQTNYLLLQVRFDCDGRVVASPPFDYSQLATIEAPDFPWRLTTEGAVAIVISSAVCLVCLLIAVSCCLKRRRRQAYEVQEGNLLE